MRLKLAQFDLFTRSAHDPDPIQHVDQGARLMPGMDINQRIATYQED